MKKFPDKICRETRNTQYVFNNFFETYAFYETMWKNFVEYGRPQMTIWRMRIACWIPKVTNAHTPVCLILDAFNYKNGCMKAPHCYVIPKLPLLVSPWENEKDLTDYDWHSKGNHKILLLEIFRVINFFIPALQARLFV